MRALDWMLAFGLLAATAACTPLPVSSPGCPPCPNVEEPLILGEHMDVDAGRVGGDVRIIGALGVPLGQIVELEGTLVPDEEKRSKRESDASLLRVQSVDGQSLERPVVLRLEPMERAELDASQSMRWVGYETGAFTGMPQGSFEHIEPRSTWGFGFDTWFVGLARLP